jgi:hypothetical protein
VCFIKCCSYVGLLLFPTSHKYVSYGISGITQVSHFASWTFWIFDLEYPTVTNYIFSYFILTSFSRFLGRRLVILSSTSSLGLFFTLTQFYSVATAENTYDISRFTRVGCFATWILPLHKRLSFASAGDRAHLLILVL